jgi:6-phosphogluconolactonase
MTAFLMAVGSLNREAPYFQGARGAGLSIFSFDSATGRATHLCDEGGIDNPTFLSVHPENGCLYANSEVFGWHEGTVSAYRYDRGRNRLVYLNKQPTLGSIAAHNSLAGDGRHLLVANYAMFPHGEGPDQALVVYPLAADGRLLPPTASVAHRGSGPHAERQERAHPHCVLQSPDGRFVIVADLGLDALLTYAYAADGTLSAEPVATTALPKGAGPRHFAFHPNGRLAVVICELDSTISSLRYDRERGSFSLIGTVPAVPPAARAENHCSDIQIHPGGRFVFGGNRGHDSIAILSIDPESGRLASLGAVPCGGATPRNLAIDPTGRFLLAANQNGDAIAVLAIDKDRGALTPTGANIPLGSPMCVKFFPG